MNHFARFAAALTALMALCLTLTGCELVGNIFKAGMWTAVILIGVVVLAGFALVKLVGGRRAPR